LVLDFYLYLGWTHHLLFLYLTGRKTWELFYNAISSFLGGMINGLLTLRGAWDKVRVEPVLKFCCKDNRVWYGYFEGPMLSLKNVNAIAHLQIGLLRMFT
jgi:cytochrome c oxidase cbb3-type subunit I/II